MRLRDVMSVDVITVSADVPANTARATMRRHRIGHLVVEDGGRLVGIVSERDMGAAGRASRRGRLVRDLMTVAPVTASPATTLRQAAHLMRGRGDGCLLVVEAGRVVGIVTPTDLLDQLGRTGGTPGERVSRPEPVEEPAAPRRPRAAVAVGDRTSARRTAAPRSALPPALPRTAKQVRGRTHETQPPAHVRVLGAALSPRERDDIARRLGARLGKFASSIERVSVRVTDVNGPKGGVDHRCLIKVALSGLPSVVVEERDSAVKRAVTAAIGAAERAVKRSVQRRRLKPLHGRRRVPAVPAS